MNSFLQQGQQMNTGSRLQQDIWQKKIVAAYQWLFAKDPKHWCKAVWTSDISMNYLCESCNAFIIPPRNRVISLLESIGNLLMKRIQKKRLEITKCGGPLCPAVQEKFVKTKVEAGFMVTTWNGQTLYQVRGPWAEQTTVNLNARTCSCGNWDLTGIPCKHDVSAIFEHGANGGDGNPDEWVHD